MGKVRFLSGNKKGFTGGLDFSDPSSAFKRHPQLAKQFEEKALELVKQDRHIAQEFVQAFYDSAIDGVLDALRNSGVRVGAVPGGVRSRIRPEKYADRLRTAKSRKVRIAPSQASVSKGSPKTITITTKPWATLGVRYQLSNPTSKRYWTKGSSAVSLYSDVKAQLSNGNKVSMSTIKPRVVRRRLPSRKGDGGSFRYAYNLSLPTLPWPLDELITQSFVSGVPMAASQGVAMPDDFTRLVYVEGRRPMIAAIAARTGEEMKKALANRTRISTS